MVMKKLKRKNVVKALTLVITMAIVITSMTLSVFAATVTIGSDATANFTNAQFYVLGSSNVTTYTTSAGTTVAGSIYPNDLCTVLDATGTYWKVSYPITGGTKIAYCNKANILSSTSYCKRITIDANSTVYRKSDMSTSFGTVYTTDTIYMLCPISNGKAQIIYNISGGYKIGWIYATESSSLPQTTSWRYPMDNAYCTWTSYTNMSWANYTNRDGDRDYHVGIDIYGTYGKVYAAAVGQVAKVGWNSANGNYVIIKHNVGGQIVYSFYAHLASYSVSSGTVQKGQQIGVAGNTGSASAGTHLHFAVVNTLSSTGGYYGYVTYFTGNKVTYSGTTFYNPNYFVSYNAVP